MGFLNANKVLAQNTSDLIVGEKKKVCISDVLIPGDSRIEGKELEIRKKLDLKIEI